MSDEEATLETEDSAQQQDTQETNWEQRYKDTQAEFTRKSQTLTDREALLAHIQENFPDMIAEEATEEAEDEDDLLDDEETPSEPKPDPRVDNLVAWQAEQQFEKDLKGFVGDRELTDKGRKVIQALTLNGGNNAQALKAAVDEWFEIAPPVEEEKPSKKKAPHVLAGGTTATDVPDFSEMTRGEVDQWMIDRARALEAQT